jgi:hypothetical protein
MLRRLAHGAFAPALMTLIAATAGGCSSDEQKDDSIVGDIRQSQTWKNGTKLGGLIRIFEGATVEIEPGARIECTDAVLIQVGGVLRVKSAGQRAKITCPRWRGIQVVANGEVELEGIDLENPETGFETTRGAKLAKITDSSILNSTWPMRVGAATTMEATRVKVTTPTTLGAFEVSVTEVFGTFIGKYIDYEANGNEGIMAMRDGVIDLEDSTLKAKNGYDLVSSYGGKSVKVRYTTMTGAHCGVHIAESKDADKIATGSFEIDHVTSEGNIFGITIYAASDQGPHAVRSSNFQGTSAWLDLQGPHGPIAFENVYFEVDNRLVLNTDPVPVNKAPARIDNAKPR